MTVWLRYQVTIPHTNGLPKDAAINTFAFRSVDPASRTSAHGDVMAALANLYSDLTDYISSQMKLSENVVKAFDLTEPSPRLPFDIETMTLDDPLTNDKDLPPEVAMCVSFQGALESGVNMRRRRGRVFLGPLQIATGLDMPIPPSAWPGNFAGFFYDRLVTGLGSSAEWCVYSRLTHYGKPIGGTIVDGDQEDPDLLPASFTPVTRVWCDDAWDTQRRRGTSATSRAIEGT